jgi:hypothetical protein
MQSIEIEFVMMERKKLLHICLCLVVSTIVPLSIHIFLQEWTKPLINKLLAGFNPESSGYTVLVKVIAYCTTLITITLIVFLYYHTNHLLPIKQKLAKALIVACILLEIKGELIRLPVMNIVYNYTLGMSNPFSFVLFYYVDKWLANFMLALSLVYLCPPKYNNL